MGNPYKSQAIPKSIIVRAIENNSSMQQAAASIYVSYNTFKKYAVMYDVWAPIDKDYSLMGKLNKKSRKKHHWTGQKELGIDKHNELKRYLITEGLKEQRCDFCGTTEYRKSDMLSPLMVWFENQDENDHEPSNIKFYCYNDYFMLYDDKFKPTQARLSAQKPGADHDNRFTRQLDTKLDVVKEQEEDAKKLGIGIASIFTSK